MSRQPSPERDPRRVRIGLILLTVVVIVAAVLAVVVDSGLARLIMCGIVVFTVLRTLALVRTVRRDS